MPRLLLALALALACSSCAAILSNDRFTPVEVFDSEPLDFADSTTLTTRDHLTPTGGMLLRFSGPDGVGRIQAHGRPIDVVVRDRSTGLWALGPLLPIIPTFGFGKDDPDNGLTVQVLLDDELEEFLWVDPRAVRLRPSGSQLTHAPDGAADWGYFAEHSGELPPVGERLPLNPGTDVVLFFEVSFGELAEAGGFELELDLATEAGEVRRPRIRYELAGTCHLVLAG